MTNSQNADAAAASVARYASNRRRLPPPEVRRALRIASGVSAAEIARSMGVTRQAVSKWERGVCIPTEAHMEAYLAVLDQLGTIAGARL